MKILCTGDLHIGRRPSHIPQGSDPSAWSAGRFFEHLVDRAIREQVDAVAISGDLIDKSNRFFEASAPLENGLVRLAERGIETVAVAGNHDHDALPRFADAVRPDRFHLLGRGGVWESVTLERGGRPWARFDGWSFPAEHVRENPLLSYSPATASVPVIGLLHADFDTPDSAYAPVRRADLDVAHVSCWLLGHIHRPGIVKETMPLAFYPGSPQGLDAGEPGPHGPWLLDLDIHPLRPVPIALAPIRFDRLEFDVTDAASETEFQARSMLAVRAHTESLAESGAEHVVCRLRATGRSALRPQIARYAATLLAQESQIDTGGCTVTLEEIDLAGIRPLFDLADLAPGSGPPAVLSRLLLSLEAGERSPEIDALVKATREKLRRAGSQPVFAALDDPIPDDAQIRDILLRQGYRALDALLAQKEAA
jgi:predicted phosphodiesterase